MICPTCGKTAEWQDNPHRPFCSERCKLIDFGRWANEEYRVPAEPAPVGGTGEERGEERRDDER
ncbi:MAG TPA: DNA gyrase inhibitor YacG [Pyrinomonadaceae bacterium]|nr:DNA gyrase inhibitor YacG [Pyrinomonadaceae bacterium]